ncbi:hypothetical protein ACIA8K_07050 [Catenuloplanes sp. NPDC051500]|uniref:hypothetical protein n=1 Tax=Catenuloplanes sp. NPDC051500 TaxID=3363959 RepID=UPI0037A45A6E
MPGELQQPPADSTPKAEDYVTAAGSVLAVDAIEKINAGAALAYALYYQPAHKIRALTQDAPGLFDAMCRAQVAYEVGARA